MVYAAISRLLLPLAWWGRVRTTGIEVVPERGPVLVVPNHDSQMDPVMLGVALRRRRMLRFLARADLWRMRGLGPIMNGMRQIPIERGKGDARALDAAVAALHAGEAICVFPEGKLSLGERLRARSGVARLRAACPEAVVVLAAISGTTDYVRFPRRPRVRIELFQPPPGVEEPQQLLDAVRERVPPAPAGRAAGRQA
ncbi:MAG: 1-acyl-sn-glycerol-3-phosphate acyltransferase [Thermoleophilaceae bacterium]|nr:1-acyl-sn-glycerol-3-phosphate acyltransferase [Thermoleophilaceae bacterium]